MQLAQAREIGDIGVGEGPMLLAVAVEVPLVRSTIHRCNRLPLPAQRLRQLF
jgi:hypothetical protein